MIASLLMGSSLRAQALRGVTVDAGDRPISGVVVTMVDSTERIVARALTNDRGEFRLTTNAAGEYRVRTLRIGFRPVLSEAYALSPGGESTARIVLSDVAVMLDTIRATSRSVCGAFTDAGAATYAAWEQARAALTATELAAASRAITSTTVSFEREHPVDKNDNADRLPAPTYKVSAGNDPRIWRTLSVDSLHKSGYVVTTRDNSLMYYAPGFDMLLSNLFVEDHCFRLTSERASPGLLGIAFEPTPERKRIPEVRGTLWLDRSTSELRRLEFRYANVPRDQQDHARGELQFARLRDGTWVITDWSIRMPVLEMDVRGAMYGFRAESRVGSIRETGGTLALARRASDTLWAPPPITVSGLVRDSLSGSAAVGARISAVGTPNEARTDSRGRYSLTGLRPGQYTFSIRTPSLDSLNTEHREVVFIADASVAIDFRVPSGRMIADALCGRSTMRDSAIGIIVGNARLRRDSTSAKRLTGLRVIAEWNADTTDPKRVRQLAAGVLPDGNFRVCGVPLTTVVTLQASADSAEMVEPSVVRFAPATRMTRTSLLLDRTVDLVALGATFTGIVISDSSRQPIVGAEVAVTDLGKSMLTDERGAFRVGGIPQGDHRVTIRRIGYGAVDTVVKFTGHETVERRVVLGRVVSLEPVVSEASAFTRAMERFEEHRRLGLGRFMTRTDIAKYDGLSVSNILVRMPSLTVKVGQNGETYVVARRDTPDMCELVGQCAPRPCYSHVYIDGVLMNPTEPPVGYDLRDVPTETIEAMEVYSGPSETPVEYSRMGSNCGALVIWTRRGA